MKATNKALIFLFLLLFSFNVAFAQWWDFNWKDRFHVNVTNKENDFVFNMSVSIPVDTQSLISQGKMKSDCSDVRVLLDDSILVNSVGVKDCNSASSQIVFKYNFSALETKTFYIYFNNPNASNILIDWKKAYYALYEDFESGSTNLFDDYQYITNGGWVISYNSTYGYVLKRRYSGDCGDTFCKGSYVSKIKVASRNARITFDKYVVGNCGDYSGFGFTSDNGNYNYESKGYTSHVDMGNGASNFIKFANITSGWSGIISNVINQQGYNSYTYVRNKTHSFGCLGSSCSDIYYHPNFQNFPTELYVHLWHSQSSYCAGFVDNVKVENVGINGYQFEVSDVESFSLPSQPNIYRINITVNSLETVNNAEIFVNVSMDGLSVLSGFRNIRVYDSSMNELYFVLENSKSDGTDVYNNITFNGTHYFVPIWFKANLVAGQNKFHVIYGNASWTSFSDKGGFIWNRTASRNVFTFFDNFEDFDSNYWILGKSDSASWCSYDFNGGHFHGSCAHQQHVYVNSRYFRTNINNKMVYESRVKIFRNPDYVSGWGDYSFQMRNLTKPDGSPSWAGLSFNLNNWFGSQQVRMDSCYDHYSQCQNSPYIGFYYNDKWNRLSIYAKNNLAAFFINGMNYWNQTNTNYLPSPTLNLLFSLSYANYNSSYPFNVNGWTDWALARKWVDYSYTYTSELIYSYTQSNITILPSLSVSYGVPVNVTCLNNNLYRNGTDVTSENSTYVILPAGVWNYTCGPESQLVSVSKASSVVTLNLSPSSPITYGTTSSATCYSNHAQATLYLLRNGTNVGNESLVLPAGVWNYTCYIPESQNYTFASSSSLYTVNKASSSVTLMIAPSSPITYGTTTNAVCYGTNPETSVILYRNGINVGNHSLILAAGTYNYTCYSPPTQNYTSSYQEVSYTVNKAVNTANLYINGTLNQNYYLKYPNGIYAYGTCSNSNNIQPQLYRNGTLIPGASETTQLSLGNWTYNVYCDSNQNYTSDSKSYWVFASKPPQITFYQPNMTSYYFKVGDIKKIPIAFNTSSVLNNTCYLSYSNQSSEVLCNNYYVTEKTSFSFIRYFISTQGWTCNLGQYFMTNTSYICIGYSPTGERARVNITWFYDDIVLNPYYCRYYFYYSKQSGSGDGNIKSLTNSYNSIYYLNPGYYPFTDNYCSYANNNFTIWVENTVLSELYFWSYPTYMKWYDYNFYSLNVSRVGLYNITVYSVESNTLNENQTYKIVFVDFINTFNVRNNKGQHLPAKITFINSTYNYTVQGTSPLYVNTSQLPYGFVTAHVESPNYIPQTLYFNFNESTLIEYNITLINSGVYIKVLHEQSRAPINWYKLAITNSSDRNEVNFDTMTSGSYTNYLTVGKGYPSTPFQEFLDDDLNTYKDNPNANFTYNFGFTNATFEVWYESNGGGTIQIRAWNNVLGKWDDIKTISTGTTSRTMQTFNINNKPIPESNITTGYYGDLYQNCEGYYCPLFEVKTTGNIRLYEIRLVYPYSYNKDGYLSMNYTDFGMATGRSRITASSPLFSSANFYGERTYYVNPTTEVITNLNIYLYPNCLIQQFYALETIPFSETPKAIKGALFTIYKEFEGTIYPVDQEISSELGSAYLCVDPTSSYIFTVVHEDYKPFYSYSISFSNPNQPINVFMEVLPKESMSFPYMYFETQCKWSDNANTYDENQTYQMFGKKCPDRLPDNATSFMYTCFVNTYNTKVKINYGGLYVYRKAFSNYGSNFTLPLWNESSLPYNMNETERFEMIYNVTSSSMPLLFNYLTSDEGDYIFICYVNYDWQTFRNFTNYYTKYETRILFDKREILAPSGKGLLSGIDKNALWLIGLLFTMMVTGFFGYRFGVNSLLIFFLMWGLILTIFGGWGLNFPTGVLILAILIWLALTFGRW